MGAWKHACVAVLNVAKQCALQYHHYGTEHVSTWCSLTSTVLPSRSTRSQATYIMISVHRFDHRPHPTLAKAMHVVSFEGTSPTSIAIAIDRSTLQFFEATVRAVNSSTDVCGTWVHAVRVVQGDCNLQHTCHMHCVADNPRARYAPHKKATERAISLSCQNAEQKPLAGIRALAFCEYRHQAVMAILLFPSPILNRN